jgi:hypothetical protein
VESNQLKQLNKFLGALAPRWPPRPAPPPSCLAALPGLPSPLCRGLTADRAAAARRPAEARVGQLEKERSQMMYQQAMYQGAAQQAALMHQGVSMMQPHQQPAGMMQPGAMVAGRLPGRDAGLMPHWPPPPGVRVHASLGRRWGRAGAEQSWGGVTPACSAVRSAPDL